MADRKTLTGFTKRYETIPAFSVITLDYLDTSPNYFRVYNAGEADIYGGTSHIPTVNQHDFKIPALGAKMYTEPVYRNKLYLFNPSGNEISVVVLSFATDFDPLALIMSEMDFSDIELKSMASITGFESPLPAGNNKIGGVEVVGSLPEGVNHIGNVTISKPLPAGTNLIGSVGLQDSVTNLIQDIKDGQRDYQSTLDVIKGNQKDYTSSLADILTKLGDGIKTAWEADDVTSILGRLYNLEAVNGYKLHSFNDTATAGGKIINPGSKIKKIITMSNDGESDITVTISNEAGTTCDIVLRAGETLNDVHGSFLSAVFVGENIPFRFIVSTIS